MRRCLLSFVLVFFASVACAQQDAYPSRPVKFVVPFPAGGPLDIPARMIAQKLTDHWGKAVIVENQVGASGSIGANNVARAAPDGHTLLVTVDIPLTMFPAVAKNLPYDPQKDFRPIGSFVRLQNALFVNPRVNVASASELVALAKKQPGKLTFSSAGIASPAHFGGELFKVIAGIDLTHVPYKGAAPAITAAATGEVDMMFGPIGAGAPHVRSGKLKALGVTGSVPSAQLPGVKPLVEQGFPGLVFFNWEGVFAPASTPDDIAAKIEAGMRHVLAEPDVRSKLTAMDLEPVWDGPEIVAKAVAADLMRWRQLARAANIQAPQ
jgi:tripartite-type tricarboxylate transporter receptor subunit TctC